MTKARTEPGGRTARASTAPWRAPRSAPPRRLWEYDVERAEIVWQAFGEPDAALRAEVDRVTAFVRDELGDARGFSLDSPKSRAPRIAELRAG
ncbi:hypothetical protein [Streptomyces violascens]|uniref:hypothetical protein n=1 Tax=Streptomyces violascens TaxID=67381 RepID=UPI0036A56F96